MGIKELAAKVAEAHPELTGNKAAQVVRTVFGLISAELGSAADGAVKMSPLGSFHIATKPGEGEGAEPKRRIVLRLSKAKDEKEDKPAKTGKATPEEREAKRATRVAVKADKKAGKDDKKAARKTAKAASAAQGQ